MIRNVIGTLDGLLKLDLLDMGVVCTVQAKILDGKTNCDYCRVYKSGRAKVYCTVRRQYECSAVNYVCRQYNYLPRARIPCVFVIMVSQLKKNCAELRFSFQFYFTIHSIPFYITNSLAYTGSGPST